LLHLDKNILLRKNLHILFLNSWYPNRVLPNNGDFIQRHAEAVALKHKVTAIHVISDKDNHKTIEIVDERINRVRTLIAYLKPSNNPILKTYHYLLAYYKVLKRIDYFDIVHLNVIYPAGIIALYLKWFKQKPYIISEHWSDYYKPYCENFSFLSKNLIQLIAKSATIICPVTNNLGNAMQEFGLKNKYIKVPNVVDTNLFVPAKKIDNIYNIIHISSTNSTQKNVPNILKVINELQLSKKDFKFYLIGGNAVEFKNLSNQLGIKPANIIFKNQLPQTELVTYLQQSDVLVLFSEIESSSCVILEALSCGVKVITTDVGGASENLPKKYGLLIKPEDELALEKAILNTYNSKGIVDKQMMHQYIDSNFSPKIINNIFTKLYHETLNLK